MDDPNALKNLKITQKTGKIWLGRIRRYLAEEWRLISSNKNATMNQTANSVGRCAPVSSQHEHNQQPRMRIWATLHINNPAGARRAHESRIRNTGTHDNQNSTSIEPKNRTAQFEKQGLKLVLQVCLIHPFWVPLFYNPKTKRRTSENYFFLFSMVPRPSRHHPVTFFRFEGGGADRHSQWAALLSVSLL